MRGRKEGVKKQEGGIRSCRRNEAAFGDAVVVNPVGTVCLKHRIGWFYDDCVAERSLRSSAAATTSAQQRRVQHLGGAAEHAFAQLDKTLGIDLVHAHQGLADVIQRALVVGL